MELQAVDDGRCSEHAKFGRETSMPPLPPLHSPSAGPLAAVLGIRREHMREGRSMFSLTIGDWHLDPLGGVNGGVLYALAQYAMDSALTSDLSGGERAAALEVKINHLATATAGDIVAEAAVISRSRRIAMLEARLQDGCDRLLAVATATYEIHAPDARD
jgi:uncharacterized protein (TIGR00369 family)